MERDIRRNKKAIIIGLSPALLVYIVLVILPIFWSLYYGFTNWDGLKKMEFIGLENFKEIFGDRVFWISLCNNFYIVLASIFGQLSIALTLAVILNKKIKGHGFFRSVFFMPMVISTVVIALLWCNIFNPQIGILNKFLEFVGLGSIIQLWLGDPEIAIFTICFVLIWQYVGLYLVIFLAALQTIPPELMEAADIDGATERVKFFSITIPSIWDTIKVAVIFCIAGSLRSFDLVFAMTGGGPGHATELLATYMYNRTFTIYRYGYGSALSFLIFTIAFILVIISQTIMKREEI